MDVLDNPRPPAEHGAADGTAEPRATAVEQLAHKLRARILTGDFEPGAFLRDVKMAEEYAVSRHTFRTAALLLANQGLLRQIVNRGFHIPAFGPDDVVEITRLRGVLEGEAVRMTVLNGTLPEGALRAVRAMREAPPGTPAYTLVAADRDFHRAIIAAGGNGRLQRSYDVLEGEIELLLLQRQAHYPTQTPEELVQEHEQLLDALRSRDFDTARAAFEAHWDDLRTQLLRNPAGKAGRPLRTGASHSP